VKADLLHAEVPGLATPLWLRTTETMLERMRGLLGSTPLAEGEAMVLDACNMVHTVGMAYPIDIVFADRQGVIRKVCPAVPAMRIRGCLRAKYTIEMAAHEAQRRGWAVGMTLGFLRTRG
jgi:uncharacterized membrane protein (UPF0127 family)